MTVSSETELAKVIAGAEAPLRVIGGGTRGFAKAVTGDVLSTAGMSGIELYEPGALTIVAKAGTPVAEVEAALAAEGQRLPFEPMDHRALLGTEGIPTIGSVVAANVSGPRRMQAGACRDSLIGVRFVDGRGDVIKNGGRVMKNVTGYDLVKLMAGSYGTLGVLTEVSFKVLPATPAQLNVVVRGLSDAVAVQAMARALGSPFEVSGAAHLPGEMTMLRLEGFENSVLYRAAQLTDLLQEFGEISVDEADLWAQVRDVTAFAAQDGDVWRISVKPSDAPKLVEKLSVKSVLYDWGGGLIWALTVPGKDVRAAMVGTGGHATRVRASDRDLPVFHPEPASLAAISAGLRAQFDPRGILNPGVMG
ncbi:2-hydroxy-acid oxidase [Actibacterium mucosum KCTC 23349]|uniref:2-hydroxy-acid oxidase n=1 Tax=Actibacterium mucosum KCTC 23349 TaxID=1454373 RepID=A0A037ZGI6_9RHOB|nr:glycolate oxidase subunit GlcE [Actibacterium mucosum]KAJ54651.1 2-hydroxy-acid oxidase [Actibacterium mucosum KCTC 23349]